MAWLLAREAGDTLTQSRLLQDNPTALSDFIAAYYATGGDDPVEQDTPLLPLTSRAFARALDHVFASPAPQIAVSSLAALRKQLNLSKIDVAHGLRLSVDVWNKFETGVIAHTSLTTKQFARLADFFKVDVAAFTSLLQNSQPAFIVNRRQRAEAARSEQQGPQKQTLSEAIARSNMTAEDKNFWLSDRLDELQG